MKKIFTFLAITVVSVSAFAQTHDLSVVFKEYVTGSTLNGINSQSWDVRVTNNAVNPADSITTADTVLVYITRAGAVYQQYAAYFWSRTIPAGGFVDYPYGATIANSNRNDQMCATAVVVPSTGTPLPTPLVGTTGLTAYDTNPADNQVCITWVVTGVGLEENLKEVANKTFVANNQLIIENNSADFNSAALINVINISGQVVATENMVIERGRNTIGLNDLSTGIYVVTIQVEDKLSTTKVMVK